MEKDVAIIKVEGDLDTYTAHNFLEYVMKHLEKNIKFFIVDMSKVTFVSSSGWGALSSAFKRSKERGGNLVLYGLHGQVKRVYRIMGFSVILKAYDDLKSAMKNLRPHEMK